MLKLIKGSIGAALISASIFTLSGCGNNSVSRFIGSSSSPSVTEIGVTVAFDVELTDSYWIAYDAESINPAGNMSQDGRGMDEWWQSLMLDSNGTASWYEMDLETYEITAACYGTYEVKGSQITVTAFANSDESTVDRLFFEMMDGNELRLEYPENTFVYFQYEDLSEWSTDYITREQLVDYMWVATSQTECFTECETTVIDEETYYETVSFYDDDTAYWYAYNPSTDEVLDELYGYWYFYEDAIVISRNENPEDNDLFDEQYFTYSNGMLHRLSGGAIEYHFEIYGDWNEGVIEESDLYDSYWTIESQSFIDNETYTYDTLYYPDDSGTFVDLYLYEDGTGTYTCWNIYNGDVFWTVTWNWSVDGTVLTLEKPENAENPYDIYSPITFYIGWDDLTRVIYSNAFTTTEVYVRQYEEMVYG